jgi:hypothetical protein
MLTAILVGSLLIGSFISTVIVVSACIVSGQSERALERANYSNSK